MMLEIIGAVIFVVDLLLSLYFLLGKDDYKRATFFLVWAVLMYLIAFLN